MFFLNEQVAALPFECRLLFIGLWTQADREGRLEDRPARLKASLFPYDPINIEAALDCLRTAGLIIRYVARGQQIIAIPTWHKHQQPHIREADSDLPELEHETSTVLAPVEPLRKGREGKGREQEGKEDSAASLRNTTPAVLTFPTIGQGPKSWDLTGAQVAEWVVAYPGTNVLGECRKALAWVRANQLKTARGMPAFLVSWLNRAVRDGGGRQAGPTGRLVSGGRASGDRECPHEPPCRLMQDCTRRVLDEARAARTGGGL